MSTEAKQDPRVISATNGVHKTSLDTFIKLREAVSDAPTGDVPTDNAQGDSSTSENGEDILDGGGDDWFTALGGSSEKVSTADIPADDTAESSKAVEPPTEEEDKSVLDVLEIKGEKVSKKDLINAYETRQEISRRFDELGKKERHLNAREEKVKKDLEELAFINEQFEEMHELVLAQNPLGALQIAVKMARAAGGEGKESDLDDLVKQALTIADNFHNMTEEEQRLFLQKEDLAAKERKINRAEKLRLAREADAELSSYYTNVLNHNKITDAEIEDVIDEIKSIPEHKTELEKKTDPKERIQYCASYVLGKRINTTIRKGIEKVDPELAKNDKFRLALLDYVDPRCTEDDVASFVTDYLKSNGSAKGESAASTKSVVPTKSTTSHRAPIEKPEAEKQNVPIRSYADLVAKYSK